MDYDEYKNFVRGVKKDYGKSLGIGWLVPSLSPVYDVASKQECIGWKLKWAGPFVADENYVCVREDWAGTPGAYVRRFFSYHYGPYHRLEGLEDAKWKAVAVRIDARSYNGRGFHIHDGRKDRRIHQDELSSPDLSQSAIVDFVERVTELRKGKSVTDAFELRFK